ncbi:protein I'm not dead yet isoform X4 [Monomorium pharaonis]|uniref:protein I'm not dead yet isoform X4 n=1 Tax=Monomorium pharaonis TaxID=307658 RepID=UPI0017479CF3|nr:protein I'm not dead yet isoform X4 [Monomorium pharaonis]
MASRSEDLYPEIMESGERERNIGKSNEFKRLLLKFLAIYWRSFVVVLWPIILLPLLITESEKADIRSILRDDVYFNVDFKHCRYSHDDTNYGNCTCRTRNRLGNMFVHKEEAAEENSEETNKRPTHSTMVYYLVAAYASSLGGIGTIVGSGTNLTLKGFLEKRFPNSHGINFASWMLYSVPPMLLMGLLTWLWLQVMYMGLFRPESKDARAIDIGQQGERIAAAVIEKRYKELGPVSWHESSVGVLFIFVVLLWFFRSPGFMPGWAAYISNVSIKDSTAAACVTILFFMIPSKLDFLYAFSKDPRKRPTKPSLGLITWKMINDKLHWSLIFVLGGGFAISEGSTTSGLSEMLGQYLIGLKKINIVAILLIVCFFAENVTELTANVAVANIILPVLAEMCVAIKIHPLYLMLPAALCCSFSFHLPVGTPPNAIASAAGHIKTKDFMIAGIGPSIITLVVTAVAFSTWGTYVFNLSEFPEWAT